MRAEAGERLVGGAFARPPLCWASSPIRPAEPAVYDGGSETDSDAFFASVMHTQTLRDANGLSHAFFPLLH